MSYPERKELAQVMQGLVDHMIDCQNPHTYIWLAKANSALATASVFLCASEIEGKRSFYLPIATRCVKEALRYLSEAYKYCGLNCIKPVWTLLEKLEPQTGVPAPKEPT
jgi:hypothetical protein